MTCMNKWNIVRKRFLSLSPTYFPWILSLYYPGNRYFSYQIMLYIQFDYYYVRNTGKLRTTNLRAE